MIRHPKYNQGNIYLSGGMEGAVDLGGAWRTKASKALKDLNFFPIDITELDKMYQANHGDIMGDIRFDTTRSENQRKASIRLHFIEADLKLLKNDTDAVVIYYDESVRVGAGTISECQFAYDNDIPIFLVSAWEDWKKEVPSWLHALTTRVFTNFEDLYTYMGELPEGILVRDQYGNHNSGEYYLCSLTGEPFKKSNHHFVSRISPLYSKEAVDVVAHTHERMKNRYEYFTEQFVNEIMLDIDAGIE